MQTQPHSNFPPALLKDELLWTLSSQGIFRSFSSCMVKRTAWREVDWLGKPLRAFIHPSDITRIKERYAEVLAGQTVRFRDIRCVMKSGSYFAWALSFVPQMENGVISEVLVLGHLLNPMSGPKDSAIHRLSGFRRHIEERGMAASHTLETVGLTKLLESMLASAPIGFALLDGELRFICMNQMFSEMTGFSPSQQLGRPLRSFLPAVAELVEPLMQTVLATGESVIGYEAMLRSSQVELSKHAQMSFYPISDPVSGICGIAVIAADITDRKLSEAKLKEVSDDLVRSNRALEEFSFIASHDLKEPLRTISSFVSLLQKKYCGKLDERADQYISYAVDGAKRMQLLIERILEYSRAGIGERKFTDVDCTLLVQTVIRNLETSLQESGGIVTYNLLPTVYGNELLLSQIFQNLLENAIKYSGSAQPKIHISAKRNLDVWEFSVADAGIGISPDQFLNVFLPFRKLHSQSEYGGSGLGLAICEKNVQRQGGKIWVRSAEGKGSVFSFTIPALSGGRHLDHESK